MTNDVYLYIQLEGIAINIQGEAKGERSKELLCRTNRT
jgi:hypothetical protein